MVLVARGCVRTVFYGCHDYAHIGDDVHRKRRGSGGIGKLTSLELVLKGSRGQDEGKLILTSTNHHRKIAVEWLKSLKKVRPDVKMVSFCPLLLLLLSFIIVVVLYYCCCPLLLLLSFIIVVVLYYCCCYWMI